MIKPNHSCVFLLYYVYTDKRDEEEFEYNPSITIKIRLLPTTHEISSTTI